MDPTPSLRTTRNEGYRAIHSAQQQREKGTLCFRLTKFFFSIIESPLSYIYNQCKKPSATRKVRVLSRPKPCKKILVNEKEITIFAEEKNLTIRLVRTEKYQRRISEGDISLIIPDNETCDSFLQNFRPVVVLDEHIQFLPICLTWSVDNFLYSSQKVRLLWSPDGLVWHWGKSKSEENESYQALASVATTADHSCALETKNAIESFLKISPTPSGSKCSSFFGHFEITQANNTKRKVIIKPKTEKSRLNPNTLVSYFQWAVAAITHGGATTPTLYGLRKNHAQLVVEGMDDNGKYFMWLADFDADEETGSTFVNIEPDMARKKLNYSCRSDVWKVPKDEVSKMWDSVLKDKNNPSSLPRLHIRGRGSIGVSEGKINCFDWVKEKLEMIGIVFPKGNKIVTITSWNIYHGVSKRCKHPSHFFSPEEDFLI